MKTHIVVSLLILSTCLTEVVRTQTESAIRRAAQGKITTQEDLVSFRSDIPYSKAIQSLNELSKKREGKIVIDRSPLSKKDKAIGINIESMFWKDALELILRSNQLWYNDFPEYLEIVPFEEVGKLVGEQPAKSKNEAKDTTTSTRAINVQAEQQPVVVDSSEYYANVNEIVISSVFFDLNRTKMSESGVSFSIFRGKNLNLEVALTGASSVTKKVFSGAIKPTDPSLAVTVEAAINIFESEQMGEVLARPQITVRNNGYSTFQIGQDFSVMTKDFAGNTVQQFYPTGTILTVHPKIYKIGNDKFVDVAYRIEKSSFEASTLTTMVNKTLTAGSMTLLDKEEGHIGGMFSTEQTTVREGVPLLKDLPWWVLGLRYLFGFDSKKIVRRELIVLLKAEILPTLEERLSGSQPGKQDIPTIRQQVQKSVEQTVNRKLD